MSPEEKVRTEVATMRYILDHAAIPVKMVNGMFLLFFFVIIFWDCLESR
jgi:hypothetical protein